VTGPDPAIPPLVVEFSVAAGPEQAFRTWVERAHLWWPRGHTRSGAAERIVFEPHVGGRVYEVDGAGDEHDWGRVAAWDPPASLRLSWHHVFPAEEATDLHVSFRAEGGGTTVRIVQTGWEVLGAVEGAARRDRTVTGWTTVTSTYRQLLAEGA
jgi:Activator of Hsp90 ATPase homolog 1-like protein